jgi:hypothetical protein
VPFTVAAAVEVAKTMDMVKKKTTSSSCASAETDEAGVVEKHGHQVRHVSHLFFLFRRSLEFALGRAC